jgi:hypothetical protein
MRLYFLFKHSLFVYISVTLLDCFFFLNLRNRDADIEKPRKSLFGRRYVGGTAAVYFVECSRYGLELKTEKSTFGQYEKSTSVLIILPRHLLGSLEVF